VQGSQISLSIGLVGVFFSLILGIVLVGISGYYGGRIDFFLQRVIDFLLSLPTIPIWLAMAAAQPVSDRMIVIIIYCSVAGQSCGRA
ncbi:ABC transporter permease, partial [Rhizobium ruizarguesonis]